MAKKSQFPMPFKQLLENYSRLKRSLPVLASNIAVNEFKENFRRQGYRGDSGTTVPWKARKNTDAGRGILTQSGRLRKSLRKAPRGMNARVVTNVPYAEIHNEGFKGTQRVKAHYRQPTKGVKVATGKKSKSGKPRTKTMQVKSGKPYKVKAFTRRMNMPARPFMTTTAPLINDINKMVDDEINRIFFKSIPK